jgi:hypothetical protein
MRWFATMVAVVGLVACRSGPEETGRTLVMLEEAQSAVHGFQPWGVAEPLLKDALGEPDSTEGEAWTWTAKEGEACHTLTVTRIGSAVGSVTLEQSACQ